MLCGLRVGSMMVSFILFFTLIVSQKREEIPVPGKVIALAMMLYPKLHLFPSPHLHNYFPFNFSTNFSEILFWSWSNYRFLGRSMTALQDARLARTSRVSGLPLVHPSLQQQNCLFKHNLMFHGENWCMRRALLLTPVSQHHRESTASINVCVGFVLMPHMMVISLSSIF